MADCILKLPATFAAHARAAGELRRVLAGRGIGAKPRYSAELVFEEIISNIIRHGCSDHAQCAIEVALRFEENAIVMSFHDNGPPFDPRAYELPTMPRSFDSARDGGLGLLLVSQSSERIDYEWTRQNKNHLTVTITIRESAGTAAG